MVTVEPKVVAKTAERQMRNWALGLEVQQRTEHQLAVEAQIHPYIAISRETGAGGSEIARRAAERLGWQVIDKELLDFMADRYKLRRDMLEFVDETTCSWIFEAIGKWLDQRLVNQSEYVAYLGRIVVMAARHASAVFVGRGVQFILPREKGLTVRIVGPLQQRIQNVMRERNCDRRTAVEYVNECDQSRANFVRRYFHHDVTDRGLYDLLLHMGKLQMDEAVDLLVDHCQKRFSSTIHQ